MNITCQQINEILAKGTSKTSEEIKKADAFLKSKKGIKPTWLDEFLMVNRNKMVETICRTTQGQEMASTSGYNEGYFNEIIQNANDLHCGSIIEITVDKTDDLYSLSCKYKDRGFSISNIYGFLNREMSDKSVESEQSGKFGIGIKSLFSFAQKLTVKSNIIFDFSIEHKDGEYFVKGDVELNENWDNENTILTFEYDSNVETTFNIEKLTKLVNVICEDESSEVVDFFWSDDIRNMIFDIRSLIFMNAVGNKAKPGISKIVFTDGNNEIFLEFIPGDPFIKDNKAVRKVSLRFEDYTNIYEQEFLFIKTSNIAIAYPLEEDDEMSDCNRHYATYFIRNDEKGRILPVSALIHSNKYVNMHRTDFGNNEEDIYSDFKKLSVDIREIFEFMCSKDCGCSPLSTDISNIFHKLLFRYLEHDVDLYPESPFSINGLTTEYLPKTKDGDCKRFVVNKETNPGYSKVSPLDPKNIHEILEKLYISYFEKAETIDYVKLSRSTIVIDGVKDVYDKLADISLNETSVNLWRLLGYFPSTSYLICYRITGDFTISHKASDNQIDNWLLSCNEKEISALLKLFGRSNINDAIAFDGSIISKHLSFHGYLFNNYLPEGKGVLAIEQNKYFDNKYRNMKEQLLKRRLIDTGCNLKHSVRYFRSYHGNWDGYFDYISIDYWSMQVEQVTQPMLLLEKFSTEKELTSKTAMGFGKLLLFETEARAFYQRNQRGSTFYEKQQQIVNIDFLRSLVFYKFTDYCKAVDCIDKIKHCIQNINAKCVIQETTTEEIKKSFIIELSARYTRQEAAFTSDKISFKAIASNTENDCSAQMQDFLYRKSGKIFYVYNADFGLGRKKTVCYFSNDGVKYRSSAESKFSIVSSVSNIGDCIYIFCSNFGDDVKGVVSLVMKDIGVDEDVINLFDGYMTNRKSINTLSYTAYSSLVIQGKRQSLLTGKKKLLLDFAQVKGNGLFLNYDNSFLIKLLSARGSYDIYCPICADIPIEAFIIESKKKPSRNLIVLENSNATTKKEFPFIVMLACDRCKQKLSATLHNSSFNGKSVTLTFNIAHGQHEIITYKQTIELSPINIAIMKEAIKR